MLFSQYGFVLNNMLQGVIRQKKKNVYVALSRPTVKCEKTGSGFFFFFFLMSDLGEEFAKICIQCGRHMAKGSILKKPCSEKNGFKD